MLAQRQQLIALIVVLVGAVQFISAATPEQHEDNELLEKIDLIFNSDCVCVYYYQCSNGTIIEDGRGIIVERFGEEAFTDGMEGKCKDNITLCCKKPEDAPLVSMMHQTKSNQAVPDVVITSSTTPRAPIKRVPPKIECGKHNPEGVGFRQQGDTKEKTEFGEFPWMAAILYKHPKKKDYEFKCGGSLIHPQVVLTAAHCIKFEPVDYKIRLGEWNMRETDERLPHVDRKVKEYIRHEEYNSGNLHYDVGVIILDEPVPLSDHVNIACLPPHDITIPKNVRCWASGWGKDVFSPKDTPEPILKKVELPIIEHVECQAQLKKTRLGEFFKLHDSFICAGGETGRDTCKGDGGSPLVCPIPGYIDRYYQAGIVSWGLECGTTDPALYANVPYVKPWVDKIMKKHNFDIDYNFN